MSNDVMEFMANNSRDRQKYTADFARIFGTSLKPYWNNLTRFDIILFDSEFLKTPDDKSAEEVIRERYGEEAVTLVYALIGANKDD